MNPEIKSEQLSPPRLANGLTPPGCRMLHIPVRDDVFRRAKAQALLTGMRFPEFVARLLLKAGQTAGSARPEQLETP